MPLYSCSLCSKQSSSDGKHLSRKGKLYCSKECYLKVKIKSRYINTQGYWIVKAPADYPFSKAGVKKTGWIYEHVLVATKALGRQLKAGEVVHHIDCNKLNNNNSNLLICTTAYHRELHGKMGKAWANAYIRKVC